MVRYQEHRDVEVLVEASSQADAIRRVRDQHEGIEISNRPAAENPVSGPWRARRDPLEEYA